MIKIEKGQINIYMETDKKNTLNAMALFFVASLLMTITYCFTKNIFCIILAILPLIPLVISIYIYMKQAKEEKEGKNEKLKCSLSKNEFIIYENKKVEKYNTNQIISFSVFPDPNLENYISLNYKNEKGKEISIPFMMQGCSNIEFVNLANNFLKGEALKETPKGIINTKYNTADSSKIIKELIKTKKKIECTLIGKTKMFFINGSSYSLGNIYSDLLFVDSNNNIFRIYIKNVKFDFESLNLENTYEVFYDNSERKFILKNTNNKVNTQITEDFRKDITYSSKILFEKDEILSEIIFFNKYIKFIRILDFSIILVIISFFSFNINCCAIFISIMIILSIFINLYPKRYMKNKMKNKS